MGAITVINLGAFPTRILLSFVKLKVQSSWILNKITLDTVCFLHAHFTALLPVYTSVRSREVENLF